MCNDKDQKFSALGTPRRVWAVSAIHGERRKLQALHDVLYRKFQAGDRIVYLGNYTGHGTEPCTTVDEILTFRRTLLALPGVRPQDFAYLRGVQEEMWQMLLRLPYAPKPQDTLSWLLSCGMGGTLGHYGIDPREGQVAAKSGVMALVRWGGKIRDAVRRHAGHEVFSTHQRRAAFTADGATSSLLFVNAGLDPALPLAQQEENFWWASGKFSTMDRPYDSYAKVVRGYDPEHRGVRLNCVTATLDGGCGFGGSLICAGFDNKAAIFDLIEA